jgi:hypothetical protein
MPELWEQMDVTEKLEELCRRIDRLVTLIDVCTNRCEAELLTLDRRLRSVECTPRSEAEFSDFDQRLRSVERIFDALNGLLLALLDKAPKP